MKLSYRMPDPIGFQLAPMLDVVFLLLIFFVVTQKFMLNEQDLKVKVPSAPQSSEEASRAIDELIINVREDEQGGIVVTIDRERFSLDQLESRLRNMARLNPSQPVRIRGDAEARWQKIVDVIARCNAAGVWNVSFSKKMPPDKAQETAAPAL